MAGAGGGSVWKLRGTDRDSKKGAAGRETEPVKGRDRTTPCTLYTEKTAIPAMEGVFPEGGISVGCPAGRISV